MAPQTDDAGLIEGRGKWVLPVGDGKVTQILIDFAFTLVVEAWIEFRIEGTFTFGAEGDMQPFEPSDSPGLAPLLRLHQATVTSAEIRKDGRLTVTFAGGDVLLVLPDERYEAFTVTGSLPPIQIRRGFNFVALPGGGLAHFGGLERFLRTADQDGAWGMAQ